MTERARFLEARAAREAARAKASADVVRRIEDARARVFDANDGVVTEKMTRLEREWRLLQRRDPDDGLMDLWARIAPAHWQDRKMWRDESGDARLDLAVALAADVDAIDAFLAKGPVRFVLRDVADYEVLEDDETTIAVPLIPPASS